MPVTDQDQRIRQLETQVEELTNERDTLQVAIAEHVEALGHEGSDAAALRDALGQLDRLLEGKDIAAGLDLAGVAGQVEALVWLFKFGTVHAGATEYLDRLPVSLQRQVAGPTVYVHAGPTIVSDDRRRF